MIELGLLVVAAVVGAFWLVAALIGAAFKLTFGLFGALLGGVFGLFGLIIAALVVVPVMLAVVLPLMFPALLLFGLVWLIVRASRSGPAPAPTRH